MSRAVAWGLVSVLALSLSGMMLSAAAVQQARGDEACGAQPGNVACGIAEGVVATAALVTGIVLLVAGALFALAGLEAGRRAKAGA